MAGAPPPAVGSGWSAFEPCVLTCPACKADACWDRYMPNKGVSFECRACNAKYTLSKEDIFYNVKNNFGKSTNGLPKVEAGMSHTGCCSVQ